MGDFYHSVHFGREFLCVVHFGQIETLKNGDGVTGADAIVVGHVRLFHGYYARASTRHLARFDVPQLCLASRDVSVAQSGCT